ncbi:peptidylprolyl isomerase [Sedimenticola sp.]|uniref:peptidylprolyl isomerase n=1 Tax=Sedimenticola sp. TaxID=1940285 RepID=UPI003D0CBD67
MKMLKKYFNYGLTLVIMLATPLLYAKAESQVLATVDNLTITSDQLEMAVASSPFATQFIAMNEDDQAAIRGDLLRRMVISRLLYLEATHQGVDKNTIFIKEMNDFRLSQLYRHYMDKLRSRIQIPEEAVAAMKSQFKGNADGFAAARSAYLADRYRGLRMLTLQKLRDKYHVRIHEERLLPKSSDDTLLLEGDGIQITYGDIAPDRIDKKQINSAWLNDQLYKRAELLLIAKAAEEEEVDVSPRVKAFGDERLPALLVEQKQREWVPDDQTLKDYFRLHPEFGQIEERRHIGQLIVANRKQAESFRQRILAGESLFNLAGQYSIDPYGRSRNGDMGWIQPGRGMPQIEQALSKLADNEISGVIETPAGFHIITILERRPGSTKTFSGVRDRLLQAVISEKMNTYLQELEKRHRVVWNVIKEDTNPSTKTSASGGS